MKNSSRQIDFDARVPGGNADRVERSQHTAEVRVLVMQDGGHSAIRLKEWLLRYDFDIVCELASYQNLAQRVGEIRPAALFLETSSPSQKLLEQLEKIHQKSPCPVLLFSRDGRNETIRSAIRCGVTSYLVGNVNLDRLPVIVRVATARFEEERDCRKELTELKSELAQYKIVDRAVATIMKVKNCSEDDAHRSLSEIARSRGLPIGEIALWVIEMSTLLKA